MRFLLVGGSSSVSLSLAKYLMAEGHSVEFLFSKTASSSMFAAPLKLDRAVSSFGEILVNQYDLVLLCSKDSLEVLSELEGSPKDFGQILSQISNHCKKLVFYAYDSLEKHPLSADPSLLERFEHVLLGSPLQTNLTKYVSSWSWLSLPIDHEYISARNELTIKHPVRILHILDSQSEVSKQILNLALMRLNQRGLQFEKIEKHVSEIKDVRTLRELLKYADVLINQIGEKDYGLLPVEALSQGCAVISTHSPQLSEIWHPLKLSPVLNTTSLGVEAKIEAIIRNPVCLRDLAKRSRQFALTYHNAQSAARKLMELFPCGEHTDKVANPRNFLNPQV